MSGRRALLASLLIPLAACGGGGSPTGPGPVPSSGGAQSVTVVVFYDENGNGGLDGSEATRVPDVEVTLGGRAARSATTTGRAVIDGVPAGTHTPAVATATMPPYYAIGRLAGVTMPVTGEIAIPLVLSIGSNRPNTYMAFGDSITDGFNYPGDPSYRAPLADKLSRHFGRATVIGEGVGSSKSNQGALRIDSVLNADRPAYTLILYGTNDYGQSECNNVSKLATTCFTIPSLRDIVLSAKGGGSLPVLATIPPCNEGYDFRAPPQRNDWISAVDVQIRALARELGVPVADVERGFLAVGDTSRLFVDHIHPSAEGEEIIASTFFAAIAHGRLGGAALPDLSRLDAFGGLASGSRGRPRRGALRRTLTGGTGD
jgi:lysophospholipase L1-like esterase